MKYTNIRYSTTLNDAQTDYLADECQDINRMKCFKTFLRMAVLEPTKVSKKHFSAVLQPGQFMASKVEPFHDVGMQSQDCDQDHQGV